MCFRELAVKLVDATRLQTSFKAVIRVRVFGRGSLMGCREPLGRRGLDLGFPWRELLAINF